MDRYVTRHTGGGGADELGGGGAEVVPLAADAHGRVDLAQLLQLLATRNITSVLAEGGAQILGALAAAQLIDRIWAFVAPKLVGGSAAPGPVGDPGIALMGDAQLWHFVSTTQLNDDLLLIAEPRPASNIIDHHQSQEHPSLR